MTKKMLQTLIVLLAIGVCHGTVVLAETEILFFDDFDFFELDEVWGATDAGVPDVTLEAAGGILQMVSSGS